jgi:hypothetical protein
MRKRAISRRAGVFLRHWPVLRVNSVLWRGIVVPPDQSADLDGAIGYALQPGDSAPPGSQQALDLFGAEYSPGRQSLIVTYSAGYAIQNEPQTIPAAAPLQTAALAPYGPWASDLGVAYASTGAPLTPVAAAPGGGQYSVSGGVYAFSAADAGQPVSISYGFIQQDVAQAALELAAERFRAADHISLKAKSAGGQETITYDASAISTPILAMLQPYTRVAV